MTRIQAKIEFSLNFKTLSLRNDLDTLHVSFSGQLYRLDQKMST